MTEFNIGDRVVIIEGYECNNAGLEAEIIYIDTTKGMHSHLLFFDDDQIRILRERLGHNPLHDGGFDDTKYYKRCWWIPPECIELVYTTSSPYQSVIRKIKQMEKKRQELGYRW